MASHNIYKERDWKLRTNERITCWSKGNKEQNRAEKTKISWRLSPQSAPPTHFSHIYLFQCTTVCAVVTTALFDFTCSRICLKEKGKAFLVDAIHEAMEVHVHSFLTSTSAAGCSQLHAPVALPRGKNCPVHIVEEAGWAPGHVYMYRREICFPRPGFGPHKVQPVT